MDIFVLFFLVLGIYPFALYPLAIWLLSKGSSERPTKTGGDATVTVVIAAYNEEVHIEETIKNKLNQKYPADLLNIVVVSDGSTDETDSIVNRLAESNPRVQLIRQRREGKTAGLNRAVAECSSDIIVFSDANSTYSNDALQSLVESFNDPTVGYVTGRMVYRVDDDSIAGSGSNAYMRYENQLRTWESKVDSVVGVDGGVDAIRRHLFKPMKASELPDFALPLKVVDQGYRVAYQPRAVVYEDALTSTNDEFSMRVRVAARAIWTLLDYRRLVNPLNFGVFSWQLLSHKWLRYFSFAPFFLAFLVAWMSANSSSFSLVVALVLSTGIVVGAASALDFFGVNRFSIFRLIGYFFLINVSSFFGFLRVARGKRITTWQPRVG